MHAVCSDDGLWRTLLARHFNARIKHSVIPAFEYYRHHSLLEKRWQRGQAQARYMTGHTDSVYCIMRYDDRYLVSGSRDHSIRIWDLATYTCVASRTHHDGSVYVSRFNAIMVVIGWYLAHQMVHVLFGTHYQHWFLYIAYEDIPMAYWMFALSMDGL